MSTFDDDVRRDEFDDLHGLEREWFYPDTEIDPTPPHGIQRPVSKVSDWTVEGVKS